MSLASVPGCSASIGSLFTVGLLREHGSLYRFGLLHVDGSLTHIGLLSSKRLALHSAVYSESTARSCSSSIPSPLLVASDWDATAPTS